MDTFERVKTILANMLDIEQKKITLESALINDLDADSLDVVEIIMAIEEEFSIKLDDEEVLLLETVEQVVDCIETKTGIVPAVQGETMVEALR